MDLQPLDYFPCSADHEQDRKLYRLNPNMLYVVMTKQHFFPPDWGMLRRSRRVLNFLQAINVMYYKPFINQSWRYPTKPAGRLVIYTQSTQRHSLFLGPKQRRHRNHYVCPFPTTNKRAVHTVVPTFIGNQVSHTRRVLTDLLRVYTNDFRHFSERPRYSKIVRNRRSVSSTVQY